MMAPIHVGLDIRYLSHGLVGGVHSYVQRLADLLCRHGAPWRWTLYADAKAPLDLAEVSPTTTVRILPWRGGASSAANDFRIGASMARDGITLAHFPANYGFAPTGLQTVITLHDAINLLPLHRILLSHPKRPRTMLAMTYLHFTTTAAMRRRPIIITDSNYSRAAILRHARLPSDRVHVVYLAPDPVFEVLGDDNLRGVRERFGLRQRVLLADAIKNPAATLRAYRCLPDALKTCSSLVFFSRRTPSTEVQRAAAAGECTLVIGAERGDLVALYNLADLFIFPSWYEGFGLPALEAMACGTPVIASSRGSLPEVVGPGGLIVDAEDHRGIADHITRLLADRAAYTELRDQAMRWAARFSWEATAAQTLAVYERALLQPGY